MKATIISSFTIVIINGGGNVFLYHDDYAYYYISRYHLILALHKKYPQENHLLRFSTKDFRPYHALLLLGGLLVSTELRYWHPQV